MSHWENLNSLCRVCGNKLGVQYKKKEHNARQLTAALNINLQNDVDGIHPQFVCHACHRRLEWWQKRKNKQKITTPLNITVPIFEAHDDSSCKICCSDTIVKFEPSGPTLSEIARSACSKHNFMFAERNEMMYCMEIEFETRNVIKSLAIKPNGEWTLHVLNHKIQANRFQGYERITDNINKFLETLQKFCICIGNSDFMDVIKCGETILKSRSGDTVAIVEPTTIRHVQCNILSEEERCCVCNIYRPTLFSRRDTTKKENMACTPTSSHKRNDQRSREEIEEKLEFVVREKQILKRKNHILQDKIASMFQKKSRKLHNAGDNNLIKSLIENEEKYTIHLPEGTPQRLLWEEQMKAAKAKSKTAVKWHPAIIRFCIAVYHKSSAAYDTIRKSGFLNLPHQNTIKR
ncbi:uncharacterized protein LOC117118055 [Anneissia japonica]|uniref:uncharacterized protein LOC117118055 n=1 Tax=Anneissia japonica TaxID=1529436 RepID=UPI0014256B1D|nr:uncharacterized protein LOC117118055 [Anneissia japonica]